MADTKPKRGLSAYLVFSRATRDSIKREHPDLKFGDLAKVVAERWKDMSEEERAPYHAEADADKARYEREMAAYLLAHPN